jgi:hypothetical protein
MWKLKMLGHLFRFLKKDENIDGESFNRHNFSPIKPITKFWARVWSDLERSCCVFQEKYSQTSFGKK